MHLQRLKTEARRLVTPEFVRGEGENAHLANDAWEPYVDDARTTRSLDRLRTEVDAMLSSTEPHSTAIDALAATAFHRALPLTRREASDIGLWRFLAVVAFPDFVRHRWENPTFSVARGRFWRPGTRPDSNTFARLWWIAELTCDAGDYSLTRRALRNQSSANLIFTRSFCEHRPAVAACVEHFETLGADATEGAARDLHHELSTRVLATLSREDVLELLRDIST